MKGNKFNPNRLLARKKSSRGQSTVEFALVVPIFLTLLLGIGELAWLGNNQLQIANAVREGARAASVGKTTNAIDSRINNMLPSLTVTITRNESSDEGSTWDDWPADTTDASSNDINGVTSGNVVRIRASAQHQQLTNFFPVLNNITLTQECIMRREAS